MVDAMRRLGFKDGTLGPDERKAILEDLALESGIVGMTARYAMTRSGVGRSDAHPISIIPPSSSRAGAAAPDSSAAARLAGTVGVHEVVTQLAALMGQDKGEAAVLASLKRLGFPRERLEREQLVRLLDDLCRQEGHTGTTARFVKPRILAKLGP
ncbi:Hypothetical protein A7982_00661 [Minicystis rosea]|nr:Hypothetical protein A7982_00661 [Minicystis rosea]